jgi:hypothetical protein
MLVALLALPIYLFLFLIMLEEFFFGSRMLVPNSFSLFLIKLEEFFLPLECLW